MKFYFLSLSGPSVKSFLLLLAVGFLFGPAESAVLWAQGGLKPEDLRVISGTPLESNYQDMLMKYLLSQAGAETQKRLARIGALRTEADIKAWSDANRKKFLELIGGLPSDRTPLNAHVVGEVARDGYVIRKVIYESLPEFYVTANLYVPTTGKPPYPAVLSPCGHSENGKAYDVYQHLFIGLVKRGYVVLTYDPLGQGERIQYWDFLSGKRRFTFNQHGMAGIQEYLIGQNLARYFIWDGMRSLDYLASLPEVDAAQIGVTGSSGGGTLTTYITMLDPRVKAASIVTYITSIPKKIENRINDAESDPEQDIAGLLPAGIDHPEFLGMIAPRPVLLGAAIRDFFPIEGTRTTFAEAQQVYKNLNVPNHIKMVEFDHRHMYSQPLREATYAWFDRWLKGVENEVHEPAIVAEKDDVLQCTPTGQLETSLGGRTVADFNRAESERLAGDLKERRVNPDFHSALSAKIKQHLELQNDGAQSLHVAAQKVGEVKDGDLLIEKYLLATEEGIVVPTRIILPKNHPAKLRAIVYLRDRTGENDSPTAFEGMARQGQIVAVADVRGFGETMSTRRINDPQLDYFDPRDGMDADFTFASFFLGQPLLGMRVRDARTVVDFVRSRPDIDSTHISIVGRGWAGVVALFTAALEPGISSAAVEGTPVSYQEIAAAHLYNQPVSLMLPGVLRDFDLQDIFASLAPRALLVLNPENAMTRRMDGEDARRSLNGVRTAYAEAHAEGKFDVEVVPIESDARSKLLDWIARQ
jgi:cephalosporin-C deacetylase-like acetyl esterase